MKSKDSIFHLSNRWYLDKAPTGDSNFQYFLVLFLGINCHLEIFEEAPYIAPNLMEWNLQVDCDDESVFGEQEDIGTYLQGGYRRAYLKQNQ